MNKVILTGRLTKDPELKYTTGEKAMAVCRFGIAVNRRYSKSADNSEPTVDFINCVAFNKTAEFIGKYFAKGRKIDVVGRIQTGSYTNRDGQKVYTTDVVIDEAEFGDSAKNGVNNDNNIAARKAANERFLNIPDGTDEELPFA